MNTKDFDQKLFDQNDPSSRQFLITFLQGKGYKVTSNPDKFGIDLIIEKHGEKFFLEVERRDQKHWPVTGFKYRTVTIPMRKQKYNNLDFAYIIVRYDYKEVGILSRENVKKHFAGNSTSSTIKNTKYLKNESFFEIPKNEFKFFNINEQIIQLS